MRRTTLIKFFVAIAIVALGANRARAEIFEVFWTGNVSNDWNNEFNWDFLGSAGVPDIGFGDQAVINNGGTPFIDTLVPAVASLGLDSGEVEIRGGGTLTVETDPFDLGMDPNNGVAFIGRSGQGKVDVLSGGTMIVENIELGGDAASMLSASGTASIAVSEDANLGRVTRIEGPDVAFNVQGGLSLSGTFVPVITGTTHSRIDVTGNASLGGTLRPEFGGGFMPGFGETWTLIRAATVSGSFATVDFSQAPALPRGGVFDVSIETVASQDVVLSLSNRLILSVNRSTGAASIENAVGLQIEFDVYTISSPSGVLDPSNGAWQSFEDAGLGTWDEASPTTNNLSELNPLGSSILDAGSSLGIGNPYSFQPTQLGETSEDLTFTYGVPGGGAFNGIVEYTGPHNNMVLIVDPNTGEAAIQNQSLFTVDIDHYRISSQSGSLLPGDGNWFSFSDAGLDDWDEASPTAENLSELNPLGSTVFNSGDLIGIGSPFDTAGIRDLAFEFTMFNGVEFELFDGIVEYDEIPVPPGCITGDTTPCDLNINLVDLNAVRNNFGVGNGSDTSGIPGDTFPFDGFVNIVDLNAVRNNFGNMGAPAPVPEPGSWLLLCLGAAMLVTYRSR